MTNAHSMNTRHARNKQEPLRRPVFAGCVATWAAVLIFAVPSTSQSKADGLSTEDKVVLEAGELVVKEKNEQRGKLKLFGGQSWQVVEAPIDVAWRAMADLESYKHIIPLATESAITERNGDETDLAIRQEWGPVDIRYVLQTTLDHEKRVLMFRLDHSQGHELGAGWGFLRVRPWKNNQTLVSFGALVDIGDGVLVSIIRPAVRKDLLRIPTNFKGYVEGDSGKIYRQ